MYLLATGLHTCCLICCCGGTRTCIFPPPTALGELVAFVGLVTLPGIAEPGPVLTPVRLLPPPAVVFTCAYTNLEVPIETKMSPKASAKMTAICVVEFFSINYKI